ncbi:MAG: cation transporter, partial [Proteobacteria bacterium]|nr:cation transporter [Pseudomonadota bacterium]
AGIAAGEALDMPVLDGVASVIIGLILALTAATLAFECKGLLIGEGASRAVVAGIREIVSRDPRAIRLNELLTMHFGPNDVLLNLSLDFGRELTADEVEQAVTDLERRIKSEYSEITRVFIEAQSWTAHLRSQTTSRAEEPDPEA